MSSRRGEGQPFRPGRLSLEHATGSQGNAAASSASANERASAVRDPGGPDPLQRILGRPMFAAGFQTIPTFLVPCSRDMPFAPTRGKVWKLGRGGRALALSTHPTTTPRDANPTVVRLEFCSYCQHDPARTPLRGVRLPGPGAANQTVGRFVGFRLRPPTPRSAPRFATAEKRVRKEPPHQPRGSGDRVAT
jgi:hypothetical protein